MKRMILDGNSIVNRAFYGIRLLSNREGQYTNAIFGFLNILLKLMEEERPDGIAVAFDTREKTIRHEKFEAYKAQRTGMPDELAAQMAPLKELLDAMGISRFEAPGYEADDILGTFAAEADREKHPLVIVTGDKDSLQLVSEHVRVKLVSTAMGQTKTVDYTPDVFSAEYGFPPLQMVDYKALMGDPSDNIPGVPGIGKKTAAGLVSRFGGIDELYRDVDALDVPVGVKKKLAEGRDAAYLSHDLATIFREVPLPEDCFAGESPEMDRERLYDLLVKLELKSLISRFGLTASEAADTKQAERPPVTRLASPDVSAALAEAGGRRIYVAAAASLSAVCFLMDDTALLVRECDLPAEEYAAFLRDLFGPRCEKVGHDCKSMLSALDARGIRGEGFVFDTAIAAYLLNPTESNPTLEKAALSFLGAELPAKKTIDSDSAFSPLDDGTESEGAIAAHCAATRALAPILEEELGATGMRDLYYDLELPLVSVLSDMEHAGVRLDTDMLAAFSDNLTERVDKLTASIYSHAGKEFNINSTKILGEVLFQDLELPPVKKTKTGYSTDIEVLEKLKGQHPIIADLIEYRQLTKLKSTYCDGLLKVVRPDGRIHTSFNMMATATGRLSSTEPNMQNIPVRQELGSEIRKMFTAGDGCVLVDADYSQIELRVLAHIANDEAMINAFQRDEDIHTITASQVFRIPPEEVTAEERRRAKAVNFGIVYGISDFSLAEDIGVFRSEAKAYIENYLAHYAGIDAYMKDTVRQAKHDGYVTTILNRRRYLPELSSKNFNIRSFGERAAMNTPIQGSAADLIKLAMLHVDRRLKSEMPSARLVLQVHDELLVECREQDADTVAAILKKEMEGVMELRVPLRADAAWGKSWYDAKK